MVKVQENPSAKTINTNHRQISVSISKNIFCIEERAFFGHKKMKKLYIPKTTQCIKEEAFMDCAKLEKVSLTTDSKLKKIATRCFANCVSLKEIIIPENIVTIEAEAFKNCLGIPFLEIPETVKYIEKDAMSGWTDRQTILINRSYEFGDNCRANVVLVNQNEFAEDSSNNESSYSTINYYGVVCKCGHVGRNNYYPVEFGVEASSRKEAARIAREIPRVKHHHKDAIRAVYLISKEKFYELRYNNPDKEYLKCRNSSEQKKINLEGKIMPEERKKKYNAKRRYRKYLQDAFPKNR
ncbi:MAG TPA: leucine-rich repeat domain-containing protein [Bacilli bacterium]|nr:leucine-rich repeat domain-containing protein [Bacilli bacterium]